MRMRSLRFLVVVAAVLAGSSESAFAASDKVALVYNGVTEVTRETYKYLRTRLGYAIDAVAVGTSIRPEDYLGIIVLNVNVRSGVDTTLEKFVQSYAQKSKIIVVSLYARSDSTTVTVTPAAKNTLGVDAVSAASTWSERRSGSDALLAMHESWVRKVAELLSAR